MRKKFKLSNTEQQDYNANVNRLKAIGMTIPQEEKPSPEAQMLTVEQTGGPTESVVHEPPAGGYGIAVWVRIVALKSEINLCDCQVTPKNWDDAGIFLVNAAEGVPYFKTPAGVEYPKTAVLNDWILTTRPLRKRQTLEGVVIAQSFASLPVKCYAGTEDEVELCFIDQFGNRYPLQVDLMVIRDGKINSRPAHRPGLYAPSAARRNMHDVRGQNLDLGGYASISTEASVPKANGAVRVTGVSPGVGSKRIS